MKQELDTKSELRREVERQVHRKLSDQEWEDITPEWSPPYGDSDLVEVLRAAADIERPAPSMEDFARHVRRLQQRLFGGQPGPRGATWDFPAGRAILYLDRFIGADASGEVADDESPPPELDSWYLTLGRNVHQWLAADWLAERHNVEPHHALMALMGITEPTAVKPATRKPRHHLLPLLSRLWYKGLRAGLRGYGRGQREAWRKMAWEKLSATDTLLRASHEVSPQGRHREPWEVRRRFYEAARRRVLDDGDLGVPRHFWSWRAFRVATIRALRGRKSPT